MFNAAMTENDIRRAVLRAVIKTMFDNVPNQFATAIGKPPGQINDMLSTPPRKSFGAKIARQIEEKIGLEKYYLDNISNVGGTPAYNQERPTPLVANQDRVEYQTLTDAERELIIGFRNAPEEVKRHLVKSVAEYVKTDQKAA